MTIDAAGHFLPKNEKAPTHAYDIINARYPSIETVKDLLSLDEEVLSQMVSDYFTTGVAYLANSTNDKSLELLGDTTWIAINTKMVLTIMTSNVMAALLQLGIPSQEILNEMLSRGVSRADIDDLLKREISIDELIEKYPILNEMYTLFIQQAKGKTLDMVAYVLVPPEFVIRCRENPVEALATMTHTCSQVTDFINNRLPKDKSNFNVRSNIYEAHFLVNALKQDPGIQVGKFYKDLINEYPDGIYSRNINKNVFYRKEKPVKGKPSNN